MCNQVKIVLNNERCWDERWLDYFVQHQIAFQFTSSLYHAILNSIQNGNPDSMRPNKNGDVYDIIVNDICVGLLLITPDDDAFSAEISIAIFDEYSGRSFAQRAIQLYLSQTTYSKIYGIVYKANSCSNQMNHVFSKLGFHDLLENFTDRWSIDIR